MGRHAQSSTSRTLATTVECPHCDRPVDVPTPDREVEPTVSPYVAAFGEHTTAHCSEGHEFWVYYC